MMDKAPDVEFGAPVLKKRGRPPKIETRAEGVRQERRKTRGSNAIAGIKLSVNEAALDRDLNHYRFVRDEGNRVMQLEADDYEVVRDDQAVPESGTVPSHHGGIGDAGKPYRMVLMSKRRDWHEQDQMDKQKALDERDDQIRRGHVAGTEIASQGGAYTPGQNTIERASGAA